MKAWAMSSAWAFALHKNALASLVIFVLATMDAAQVLVAAGVVVGLPARPPVVPVMVLAPASVSCAKIESMKFVLHCAGRACV
jgi:hypothetical protein